MPRLKHIHKYGKSHLGYKKTTVVFRCFKVGCGHFLYPPSVVNQVSECWKCGDNFVMTPKVIKEKPGKPLCNKCWKKTTKTEDTVLDNILGELGGLPTESDTEEIEERKEIRSAEKKAFDSLMKMKGMTEEHARQILGQHKPAMDQTFEELIAGANENDDDEEAIQ